ncbi:hypothetical protein Hanom_Chr17g01532631 [Helianthus anomalus]
MDLCLMDVIQISAYIPNFFPQVRGRQSRLHRLANLAMGLRPPKIRASKFFESFYI